MNELDTATAIAATALHARWTADAARSADPGWWLFQRHLFALPPERTSLRTRPDGDGGQRRFNSQGQRDHRSVVRHVVLKVDQALERVRYERRGDEGTAGYRDGHDRPRTISSNRRTTEPFTRRARAARNTSFSASLRAKANSHLEGRD